MALRNSLGAAVLGLGTVLMAAGAGLGVDLPSSFAPRCQTDELRPQPGMSDPCREEFAILGLTGPTVLSGTGADVEATGSIKAAPKGQANRAD